MSEPSAWTIDFMREEALALAGPYSPASEPWQALTRAAHALQDAATAVRRYEARSVAGVAVIGLVNGDGTVRLLDRPLR